MGPIFPKFVSGIFFPYDSIGDVPLSTMVVVEFESDF